MRDYFIYKIKYCYSRFEIKVNETTFCDTSNIINKLTNKWLFRDDYVWY